MQAIIKLAFFSGDLMNNYCWDDSLMNICRVLFCIAVLLIYPVECVTARDVVMRLILRTTGADLDYTEVKVISFLLYSIQLQRKIKTFSKFNQILWSKKLVKAI